MLNCLYYLLLLTISHFCVSIDITYPVFGYNALGQPAAFGDFDSDELTDMFILKDDGRTVEILFGSNVEPFLKPGTKTKCSFKNHKITSVVPGDFNGDALMDVLVTVKNITSTGTWSSWISSSNSQNNDLDVHILWGGLNVLNCSDEEKPLFSIVDQPLVIDYDRNMIVDLFGVQKKGSITQRTFWIFNSDGGYSEIPMNNSTNSNMRIPQSHGFVDIGGDISPDLYLTTNDGYEVWLSDSENGNFIFNRTIPFPDTLTVKNVGQTAFMDLQLTGRMDHIVPVCFDSSCKNSTIYLYDSKNWYNLGVNFHDGNNVWGFVPPQPNIPYLETITLRPGDFNMDGYPDLLGTLCIDSNYKKTRVFLMENVACTTNCDGFDRTFAVRWDVLQPINKYTIMGAFYDFFQNGILDVLLVSRKDTNYNMSAFKNSLDYDANFLKVMVVTGLTNSKYEMLPSRLGKKSRTFGTNLPGPKVSYLTTTQDGDPRQGTATQLPQSAHYSLYLPYTIFGLGRTPNFVDELTVSVLNETRSWTQIIPNSQMVVIPTPINDPIRWNAKLFVTPSRLILQSALALAGTCLLILVIIGVLYLKERQEDRIEKRMEAHKFHFDAM
ncbi:T-cell immunomodulatory protein [Daktulosphaira vitifoliae]|uniref:T-cell immunomodulatory protein n=1 Tax=Daktulosphaira vitifoliae TaxID=58002 RepID=UPI0021AA3608|nr:T-cell immunomodulatory protein [Daktulosphaira vitifoliae]